jgi:hypothetical protein
MSSFDYTAAHMLQVKHACVLHMFHAVYAQSLNACTYTGACYQVYELCLQCCMPPMLYTDNDPCISSTTPTMIYAYTGAHRQVNDLCTRGGCQRDLWDPMECVWRVQRHGLL